jgi:hypothetical protein
MIIKTRKRTLTVNSSEVYILRDALREYAIGLKTKANGVVMRDTEFENTASERRQDMYFLALDLREKVEECLPRGSL